MAKRARGGRALCVSFCTRAVLLLPSRSRRDERARVSARWAARKPLGTWSPNPELRTRRQPAEPNGAAAGPDHSRPVCNTMRVSHTFREIPACRRGQGARTHAADLWAWAWAWTPPWSRPWTRGRAAAAQRSRSLGACATMRSCDRLTLTFPSTAVDRGRPQTDCQTALQRRPSELERRTGWLAAFLASVK